jgi:hypothetical protein
MQTGLACAALSNTGLDEEAALARVRAAHDYVAAREPPAGNTTVISDAPTELDAHIQQLMAHTGSAAVLAEGWAVKIADLSGVVGFQPLVYVADAESRTRNARRGDHRSIADVSVPIPSPTQLPAQFDSAQKAWIISSADPNLKMVQSFSGEVAPGVLGFGFGLETTLSMMQVVKFGERFVLRDGYHRAYGLLSRGITSAPVFFRECTTAEEIVLRPDVLAHDVFLGTRPPTLLDYLSDRVAAQVRVPAVKRRFVIQVTEEIVPNP